MPFVDSDSLHPPANIAKMTAGRPLNDDDRYPWLERVGEWLARHGDGGVASCSALKRKYRDQLRAHCPGIEFLYLRGTPELIERRLATRPGHFMPTALLGSQFEALQPLGDDERGVTVDAAQDVDAISTRPRPRRATALSALAQAALDFALEFRVDGRRRRSIPRGVSPLAAARHRRVGELAALVAGGFGEFQTALAGRAGQLSPRLRAALASGALLSAAVSQTRSRV